MPVFAEDTDVQKYHIEWLKINHTHIPYKDLLFLINVMAKYSEWDFLCALAENVYHNDFLYRISQNLLKSTCMHHISKVDSILDKLLRDCYKQPGLCLNKAYVCKRLGKVEEAKKYYQSEYDQYSSKDALFHLLLIRCDTKQFDEDFYFQQAKNIVDNCMLNLIGYIYQNLNKNEEACMFFLRALLLDEEDMSSLSGYMINGFQIKRDEVSCVEENTVCTLRSESESVQIAIHEPKVIDDIFPNEFASCKHYSYSDMIISNLIYCEVGDEVVYQGKQYKIESICTTHKMILRYAMNVIDKLPGSVPFYATTSEQAIEDLIEFMRESSSSTEEVVSRYNSMKILSPLSVFAYSVG